MKFHIVVFLCIILAIFYNEIAHAIDNTFRPPKEDRGEETEGKGIEWHGIQRPFVVHHEDDPAEWEKVEYKK